MKIVDVGSRVRPGQRSWILPGVTGLMACTLLFGVAGSVAASRGDRPVLRVLFHATSYLSTQVDSSGNVFAPGDQVFLGGTILRHMSPHQQIGTVGLHCVATGAGGSELLCDVAFTLTGGKITGQTLFDVQAEWTQPTRKLAITGGTGMYRKAAGEITVASLSDGDESITFTFDH